MPKPAIRVQHKSKAVTPNPKDLYGSSKVCISRFPFVALLHGAHAMMNGADKYGPYNWRDKPVYASIYVDAAIRHLAAWFEREENARDSGVHHLGHAVACCGILLDAQENGNLIDDRPEGAVAFQDILDRLSKVIVKQRELRAKSKKWRKVVDAQKRVRDLIVEARSEEVPMLRRLRQELEDVQRIAPRRKK